MTRRTPRTWTPSGWVVEPVERTCRTCGAVLPPQAVGRPRLYCEAHAPARRAYGSAWAASRAEYVREYQRRLYGYRPVRDRTCPCPCRLGLPCGEPFRGYLELCRRCRRPDHRGCAAVR